jgi:hypothetical protein
VQSPFEVSVLVPSVGVSGTAARIRVAGGCGAGGFGAGGFAAGGGVSAAGDTGACFGAASVRTAGAVAAVAGGAVGVGAVGVGPIGVVAVPNGTSRRARTAPGAVRCPGGGAVRRTASGSGTVPRCLANMAVPPIAPASRIAARKRSMPLMLPPLTADNITRKRYRQEGVDT